MCSLEGLSLAEEWGEGGRNSLHSVYNNRDRKIYNAAARRRTFKTENVFIEDNNYE